MLTEAGRSNNAILSSADSLGKCCKHFFTCDGTGTLIDIKGGLTFTSAGIQAGATANTQNALIWFPDSLSSGAWFQPHAKDVLIVSCGRALNGGVANGGGHLSFYIGGAGNRLKVQPYYSVFLAGGVSKGLSTPLIDDYAIRESNKEYVFAAAKRGASLEHWADGKLTGSNSILKTDALTKNAWYDYTPDAQIALGHSVAGGFINSCGSDNLDFLENACVFDYEGYPMQVDSYIPPGYLDLGHPSGNRRQLPGVFGSNPERPTYGSSQVAQDYLFLAVFVFEDGMPDDVGLALTTMKAQALAGQKVGYTPWITLG